MSKSLLLLLWLFSLPSWAIEFTYETYLCGQEETLDTIAEKLFPQNKIRYQDTESFKKDLIQWNQHITQWYPVAEFSRIYTQYPYPVFLSASSYVPQKNLTSDEKGNSQNFLSLLYTASIGTFSEKLTSQNTTVSSSQNSFYSFGLAGGHVFSNRNHSMNASAYWSKFTPSKVSGSNVSSQNNLDIPAEIGANIYYQYLLSSKMQFSIYSGLDYENFSTFNTKEIALGASVVEDRQNQIYYGTFGLAKNIYFSDTRLTLKSSIAQSLMSNSSSTNSNDVFSGQRFLFFASLRFNSTISGHLIYKYHLLDGPTQLNISRIGLGFSISIL